MATNEVLLAARWLDDDTCVWLRQSASVARRWTIVAPEEPALSRLQEDLPGTSFIGVPRDRSDFSLWRVLRPLVASGQYAVVHALDLSAAGHASLACFGANVPLLVSVRQPPNESRYSGLVGSFERWLLGRALTHAAAIVTPSEEIKEGVLRLFPNLRVREKKIHAIPEGVDTHPHQKIDFGNGLPLRRDLGLDDETLLLGHLGPCTFEAGFPLLLDAVARLVRFGGVPSFHVVALGSDPTGETSAAIERLGLRHHVTLRDALRDLPPLLEQLDLVVQPALRAGSTRLAMESLCAGVPVLASDCAGLRETLRGSPARVVPPGVLPALEAGLRQAIFAPWFDEAAAYAPVACQRFDRRHGMARLARLYEELTTGATPTTLDYALAASG